MIGALISLMLFGSFALFSALNPEARFDNPVEALEEKLTRQ